MTEIRTNATEVAANLERVPVRVAAGVRGAVRHHTLLLETRIKARASGRPGPNVVTGDYRASWTHVFVDTGTTFRGVVGTDRPQGQRLERGYVGADRLGRVFNQPPFPHVGPSVTEATPLFLADLGQAIGRAL